MTTQAQNLTHGQTKLVGTASTATVHMHIACIGWARTASPSRGMYSLSPSLSLFTPLLAMKWPLHQQPPFQLSHLLHLLQLHLQPLSKLPPLPSHPQDLGQSWYNYNQHSLSWRHHQCKLQCRLLLYLQLSHLNLLMQVMKKKPMMSKNMHLLRHHKCQRRKRRRKQATNPPSQSKSLVYTHSQAI